MSDLLSLSVTTISTIHTSNAVHLYLYMYLYLYLYLFVSTGYPKKNVLKEKIITKIECQIGAKFYHGHDLGALDPA